MLSRSFFTDRPPVMAIPKDPDKPKKQPMALTPNKPETKPLALLSPKRNCEAAVGAFRGEVEGCSNKED